MIKFMLIACIGFLAGCSLQLGCHRETVEQSRQHLYQGFLKGHERIPHAIQESK